MFILKQYDTPLIEFEVTEDSLDGQMCKITNVYSENRQLFPIGMDVTDSGLLSWINSRIIPKNREFVEAFLSKMGLSRDDIRGIIKISMGLSVNDSYWITESSFDGKFKDYNLYDNDFVKALSLIAYTGYGSSRAKGFTSSPEFTTAGMLRKGWRRLDGKVLLYKGGTFGAANTGNEPYSEYYASQIASVMGIKHVEYGLSMWKGNLCSTCELFTDKDHSYVPIHRFVKDYSLRNVAAYIKSLGDDYYNEFVDMLVFDALIYNEDRHFGNFGLIVDNKTNKPCAFAPIFDNGLSLFNFAMANDIENLDEYAKTRGSAYRVPFENIVKEFISSRQKAQLRKMIGFKFGRNANYNLPAKRLRAIEKHLQSRVTTLLNL